MSSTAGEEQAESQWGAERCPGAFGHPQPVGQQPQHRRVGLLASATARLPPSLVRMRSWWLTKSNSESNAPLAYGIAEVVSPRGVTYSVACHQWLTSGAWAIRTLPMIWVHMCTVARVSGQSDSRSRGHPADRRT